MRARYSINLRSYVSGSGWRDGNAKREFDTKAEAMAEFEDSAPSMLIASADADDPSRLAGRAYREADHVFSAAVVDWGEGWRDEDAASLVYLAEIRLEKSWAWDAATAWVRRECAPLAVVWEYPEPERHGGRAGSGEELKSYGEWEDFILDLIARANGEHRPEGWRVEAPKHILEPSA